MPLVGGADLNGTASGDPTDVRFNHPYRASPTGLIQGKVALVTDNGNRDGESRQTTRTSNLYKI
eukprot:1228299-Pleurochrysis_carterae.AAC.1